MASRSERPTGIGRLARRLRSLRESAHLTQSQLAEALGGAENLSASTISTWESGTPPPKSRLVSYARLFCAPEAIDPNEPRLPELKGLEGHQLTQMQELEKHLLSLREVAVGGHEQGPGEDSPRVWHFADGAPVTIVCSELPTTDGARTPYTDRHDPDYIWALSLGDLDALIDVYGEIRAENPASLVRIRAASKVRDDEINDHLVLIGGIAYNSLTRWHTDAATLREVPICQAPDPDDPTLDLIEVQDGDESHTYRPKFVGEGEKRRLIADVGMFARLKNPHNPRRTLTVCNGVHTRGVRGAARCFIDRGLRGPNLDYVREHLLDPHRFALVLNVLIRDTMPSTPDLRDEARVLFEWWPPEASSQGASTDRAESFVLSP